MINYEARLFDDRRKVRFTLDDLSEFTLTVWYDSAPLGWTFIGVAQQPDASCALSYSTCQFPITDTPCDIDAEDVGLVIADWLSKHTKYTEITDPSKWVYTIHNVVGRNMSGNSWLDVKLADGTISRYDFLQG